LADKKPKKKPLITPAGIAAHCYINTPDTKWKDKGEYKTGLVLSGEAAEAIVKDADERLAQMRESDEYAELEKKRVEHNKKNKGNPKKQIDELEEHLPYKKELDDEGEETGNIILKFSTAASGVSKKTGKPWTKKLDIFDAKGNRVTKTVWSGSTIKVAYTVGEFYATPNVGFGVKFYLEAVRVLELVEGGSRSAKGYGFDDEEEGYDASGDAADESNDETTSEGGEGDDEETDF
jgi:hypothetical protein